MNDTKKTDVLKAAFDARPVLTAYAYALLKDWSLAQDVFQEAVIALNEKASSVDINNPTHWLKSVIKNKCVDLIRKRDRTQKREEQISLILEKKFDQILNNEKVEVHKAREQALHQCMEKLTSDSRNIIIAFYKSKFSCDRIAELYHKSTNAVRLVLSRSRTELRQCVKNSTEGLGL
jgi:RNA polymerase sigma factor (sigma-70 family)